MREFLWKDSSLFINLFHKDTFLGEHWSILSKRSIGRFKFQTSSLKSFFFFYKSLARGGEILWSKWQSAPCSWAWTWTAERGERFSSSCTMCGWPYHFHVVGEQNVIILKRTVHIHLHPIRHWLGVLSRENRVGTAIYSVIFSGGGERGGTAWKHKRTTEEYKQ